MGLTRMEREVVFGKCDDEDQWSVYSSSPVWTRRLRTLAAKHGLTVQEREHGISLHIPAAILRIRSKRDVRKVSPARREELTERLRIANAKKREKRHCPRKERNA